MRDRLRVAMTALEWLGKEQRMAAAHVEKPIHRLHAEPDDECPVALNGDSLELGKCFPGAAPSRAPN